MLPMRRGTWDPGDAWPADPSLLSGLRYDVFAVRWYMSNQGHGPFANLEARRLWKTAVNAKISLDMKRYILI